MSYSLSDNLKARDASASKNERTNRVGRAGKARRAGKIGDPRELRELEEPKASEERETYKVQEWTAFQAWTLTLVASRSQQSALA